MTQPRLERPDLFKSLILFFPLKRLERLMMEAARSAENSGYEADAALIIRTKNDEAGLLRTLKLVERTRKTYKGRIEVVVVDTESRDSTLEIARSYGAKIVSIPQADFNYPKAINMGLQAVSEDIVAAFITVGHAQPVLSNFIQAGVRHFKTKEVTGVYGRAIAHENASIWERIFALRTGRLKKGAHRVGEPAMGVMGATNCMIRMATWRTYPFDEAYGAGGEDYDWAKKELARGETIIFEPALSVHHSHGLGLINYWRQYRHWQEIIKGPQRFSTETIKRRRPDLFR